MRIRHIPGRYAVCRLDPDAAVPGEPAGAALWSATRTPDELSLVCPEEAAPAGARVEDGFAALMVEGPLDFSLTGESPAPDSPEGTADEHPKPHVCDLLGRNGLIEEAEADDTAEPADITREAPTYPTGRDARLQALARGDEGFLLALGYSTQRGYGNNHPFAGEIRMGEVAVEIVPDELGFAVSIGDLPLTECEMINQFQGSKTKPPQFTRGYGLAFGESERKAMGMALVDRALRADELDEEARHPAQDQEFVLSHADNVEASGFVQHLKLPHYVDFQSELTVIRNLRAEFEQRQHKEAGA